MQQKVRAFWHEKEFLEKIDFVNDTGATVPCGCFTQRPCTWHDLCLPLDWVWRTLWSCLEFACGAGVHLNSMHGYSEVHPHPLSKHRSLCLLSHFWPVKISSERITSILRKSLSRGSPASFNQESTASEARNDEHGMHSSRGA